MRSSLPSKTSLPVSQGRGCQRSWRLCRREEERTPCPCLKDRGGGGVVDQATPRPVPSLSLAPGISLIMWNALYTAEKVIIRWTLLTEACYFSVQFLGES